MLASFLGQETDGHVMVEVGSHQNDDGGAPVSYAIGPGKEWNPSNDAAALGALAPEFAAAVRERMVGGLVEVHQMRTTSTDLRTLRRHPS